MSEINGQDWYVKAITAYLDLRNAKKRLAALATWDVSIPEMEMPIKRDISVHQAVYDLWKKRIEERDGVKGFDMLDACVKYAVEQRVALDREYETRDMRRESLSCDYCKHTSMSLDDINKWCQKIPEMPNLFTGPCTIFEKLQ